MLSTGDRDFIPMAGVDQLLHGVFYLVFIVYLCDNTCTIVPFLL